METNFPYLGGDSRRAGERVLNDLRTLARDAEDLIHATAGDASERATEARARVMAALEQAKATCQQLQARGAESAKIAARNVDATIRAHPYESIGIAVGVGVLLGALIKRH